MRPALEGGDHPHRMDGPVPGPRIGRLGYLSRR
jgi:hypothetical protein